MPYIEPKKPAAKQDQVKPARVHPKDAHPGNATIKQLPVSGPNRWRKGG
jgi:hypothetical protein